MFRSLAKILVPPTAPHRERGRFCYAVAHFCGNPLKSTRPKSIAGSIIEE
jgi:hypothetical protein